MSTSFTENEEKFPDKNLIQLLENFENHRFTSDRYVCIHCSIDEWNEIWYIQYFIHA